LCANLGTPTSLDLQKLNKILVDVTGIEPVTPCLQISVAVSQLFGINNLRSVRLPLFGLFRSTLGTICVRIRGVASSFVTFKTAHRRGLARA